jgi:hypothetical protein
MDRFIDRIGGRKFAAFLASAVGLVSVYVLGFELSDQALESITMMFVAFATGNGIEHVAEQIGRRASSPSGPSDEGSGDDS